MSLCLLLTIGGREVVITLTNQAVTPPAIARSGRETELEVAIRLGQETPVTEIVISKVWSLDQIYSALALCGLALKESNIANGHAIASQDLLTQFRAITCIDALRCVMQKLLVRGDWRFTLPKPGRERYIRERLNTPPLHGSAQPHGSDGDALFVG